MNRAQRIVLLVGMAAFLVSCLIVPYIGYKALSTPAFIGYNWFHNPPASGRGSTNVYVEIDLTRMFLEWGAILIVTAAALLINGSKKVQWNRRPVSTRRFGARVAISWAGAAVSKLWAAVKTNPGLALTWGVVALLVATACILPTTTTYKQHTGSLLDKYPFEPGEVPYQRVAYPFQVVVLETLAILLAGAAVSFLLGKIGIDRKLKITWSGAGFLIAVLLLFPPMRVYDSEATSRIVESRRTQNMQAWEKLIREDSAKPKSLFDEIPFDEPATPAPDTQSNSTGDEFLDRYLHLKVDQPKSRSILDIEFPELARSATPVHHKVGKGESMWEIAKQYSISIEELIDANNLSSLRLTVGQTLLIPVPTFLQWKLDRINDSVAQSTGQDARSPKVYDREYAAKILGPSELIYKSAHAPVWLSSAPDIRLVQLGLEIGVVLFLSTAISVLILRGSRYRKSPPVSKI